jgi:CIC family chloride channel protein
MGEGRETKRKPFVSFVFFLLLIPVGVAARLGAVAFRGLIAFFHNLLIFGKLTVIYDANLHTAVSPWGLFVIFVPVVGAAGVTFLVQNFAPEAKGHGVPEVMDAVYYHKGIIRPVVAVIKSLASALSIGSGGSVGREGPIVQIGSSFGSTLGQIIRIPVWQRITLIGAGTGGGIPATFNTPIVGVLSGSVVGIVFGSGMFHVRDANGKIMIEKRLRLLEHSETLNEIIKWLQSSPDAYHFDTVGHRLVHCGSRFSRPHLITPDLI